MRKRRFLPDYVSAFKDRHGKERLRYRRGDVSHYFKAPLGTEEFREEYARCVAQAPCQEPIGAERITPGTFDEMFFKYYLSTKWTRKTDKAQQHDRRIIENFRKEHGKRSLAGLTLERADSMISRKAATPAAANKLLKILKRVTDYGVAIKLLPDNPFNQVDRLPMAEGGFHEWTEEEIAQYQARHPYGTRARLAMELMLWTGQRRSDARLIGRQHTRDGKIKISLTQQKTKNPLRLPVAPQLVWAITAMPPHDHLVYLVTRYGKPFSAAGFGNKMREWCDEADLPQCSAHGLRKAMARRLANLGLGNASIKAVGGWKTDAEVNRYTKGFDQESLAAAALRELSEWDLSNQPDSVRQSLSQGSVNAG